MLLRTAARYISLTKEMIKANMLSAMEYRFSFLFQTICLLINDAGFILVWVIFFKRFATVGGWNLDDTLLLFAVNYFILGCIMIIGRGAVDLAKNVAHGELDYFLTLPKNALWHITVSKSDAPAFGDFIFAIVLFFVFCHPTPERTVLYLLTSTVAALITLNFVIITQCIGFFFDNFELAAEHIYWTLMTTSMYPQNVFYGVLRIILMFVIPVFFMAKLPVGITQIFSWASLGYLFLFWVTTLVIAIVMFNKGVKKYESGNLINVRV